MAPPPAFSAFRDPTFPRLFIAAVLVLGALLWIAHRMTWYDVPAADLAGTYHRAPIRFMKVADLPEKVVLETDGTIGLFSAADGQLYSGTWTWDEKERILRVDDPRWDRQIRMRSTLTGARLCMRISDLPFHTDEPEHDEEVDLLKDNDAGGAASE